MEIESGLSSLKLENHHNQANEAEYICFEGEPLPIFKFELTLDESINAQQYITNKKIKASRIVLAMTGHPQAFVHTKIQKNKINFVSVGHLNFVRTKQMNLAELYVDSSSPDILFIVFNFDLDPESYDQDFGTFLLSQIVDQPNAIQDVLILDTLLYEQMLSQTASGSSSGYTKKLTSFSKVLTSQRTILNSKQFPSIPLLAPGNKLRGMTATILIALEIKGIQGEAILISPNENEIVYSNVQEFSFLKTLFPALNAQTTVQDFKVIIQKLNAVLFASGMFL